MYRLVVLSVLVLTLQANSLYSPTSRAQVYVPTRIAINGVVFSPDGHLLAAGGNACRVDIWQMPSGRHLQTLPTATAAWCLAFSPDGKNLAVGREDGGVEVYRDTESAFKPALQLANHSGSALSIAYSPDGKLLAFGTQGASYIIVCDARSGEREGTFRDPSNGIESLEFSPDGKWLLEGGESVTAWKLSDLGLPAKASEGGEGSTTELRPKRASGIPIQFGGLWIKSAHYTPNGKQVASAGLLPGDSGAPNSLALYDSATGKQLRVYTHGPGELRSTVFSPDGTHVAACSLDGSIRIWETSTGRLSGSLRDTLGAVHALAYDPLRNRLASGGDSGVVNLWDLSTGKLVTHLYLN